MRRVALIGIGAVVVLFVAWWVANRAHDRTASTVIGSHPRLDRDSGAARQQLDAPFQPADVSAVKSIVSDPVPAPATTRQVAPKRALETSSAQASLDDTGFTLTFVDGDQPVNLEFNRFVVREVGNDGFATNVSRTSGSPLIHIKVFRPGRYRITLPRPPEGFLQPEECFIDVPRGGMPDVVIPLTRKP